MKPNDSSLCPSTESYWIPRWGEFIFLRLLRLLIFSLEVQILGYLKRGIQYIINRWVLAGDIVGMAPHLGFPARLAIIQTHKPP